MPMSVKVVCFFVNIVQAQEWKPRQPATISALSNAFKVIFSEDVW